MEWLKLDDNQLTSVTSKSFLPKSLHGVDLHNNPWKCDCNLQELRTWLVKYNVPSSIEPKCSEPPRLQSQVIKTIKPSEFACAPEIRPTSLFLDALEGKNVSFECYISAKPSADVYWTFNGNSLENSSFVYDEMTSFYVFEERGFDEDKVSHLRIEMVTEAHAGVFQCIAVNQAGKTVSNYTLRVSAIPTEPPPPPDIWDNIIYIAVGLISLIVIVIILCCILIIRCCRKKRNNREKSRSTVTTSGNGTSRGKESVTTPSGNNMPKYIQMGTPAPKVNGMSGTPPSISMIETSPYRTDPNAGSRSNPDLISDGPDDRSKPARTQKKVSIVGVEEVDESGTRTTRRLDDIIEEYEESYDPGYDQLQRKPDIESKIHRSNNSSYTVPMKVEQDINQFPLIEIPNEEMPPGSRFYDRDGFPVDYGLPREPQWKETPGQALSNSYTQLPSGDQAPMYATVRRNRQNGPSQTELRHDQKYPEEYHVQRNNNQFRPPDGRYPQSYGLMPEPYNDETKAPNSCDCCPSHNHLTSDYHTTDPGGRISGDGCSFDNLLSCGGSQCCYNEQSVMQGQNSNDQMFDNSLPENYRPLDIKPPPPEGWRDSVDEDKINSWCEDLISPSTRVLYSPDDGYNNKEHVSQDHPEGTDV